MGQHTSEASSLSGDTTTLSAGADELKTLEHQLRAEPSVSSNWSKLEAAGSRLGLPERVIEIYRSVLALSLDDELADALAQGAVAYCEEWLGDDPEHMRTLLREIVARDPLPHWAFDRLAMVLTVAEAWAPLLDLYDHVLTRDVDDEWRRKLLRDGAQIAKDFADDAARGISFLQQLLRLEPSDVKLATNLERWAQRRERWDDLVEAWRVRATVADREGRRELWDNMVECLLDKLDQPQAAFDEIKKWLTAVPGDGRACAQLERVVLHRDVDEEMRHAAISLLRSNHEQAGRARELVDVLERALEVVGAGRTLPLRREVANRRAATGSPEIAIRHYAVILLDQPGDMPVRREITRLADELGAHRQRIDAYVDAGTRAGGAVGLELVTEAASIAANVEKDAGLAIDLLHRALGMGVASPDERRELVRELVTRLDAAGREHDKLDASELLLELETDPLARRVLRRDIASLAMRLGVADRAIVVWQGAVDENPTDIEALDELVAACEREQYWSKLVAALEARADARGKGPLWRSDLERVADLAENRLDDLERAAEVWQRLHGVSGGDAATYAALDRLLGRLGRWRELADVLLRRETTRGDRVARLHRAGGIVRDELGDAEGSLAAYAEVLDIDPAQVDTTAAVVALVDEPSCRARAVGILVEAYRRTGDAAGCHALLEPRLELEPDTRAKARLLRESSRHCETTGDRDQARTLLERALVFDGRDTHTQDELRRLAASTSAPRAHAEALIAAASSLPASDASRCVELRLAAAAVYCTDLEDFDAAFEQFAAVVLADERHLTATCGWFETAVATRRWEPAARAAWSLTRLRTRLDADIIDGLQSAGDDRDAWQVVVATLATHCAGEGDLDTKLLGEWAFTLARWSDERLGDTAGAIAWIARARAWLGDRRDVLQYALVLHRPRPDATLIEILGRLDRCELDATGELREAAEVALDVDRSQAAARLRELHAKCEMLRTRGETEVGRLDDQQRWAAEQLTELALAADEHEAAAHWLCEHARVAPDPFSAAELRHRAARALIAAGRRPAALEILERISAEAPSNVAWCREVIELCRSLGRRADLLRAYRRLVEHGTDPDELVEARLAVVELTMDSAKDGGVVELLRCNLEQRTGDDTSLERLTAILTLQGNFAELARVLQWQASVLRDRGDAEASAELWTRASEIHRSRLHDEAAAARTLAAGCELVRDAARVGELIEAYERLDDPASAAYWLARRLEDAAEPDKVAILLRLATLQRQADLRAKARESLALAFDKAPRNRDVRDRYLAALREERAFEQLVAALARASEAIVDSEMVAAYAREAREIATHRLDRPDAALPALRRASALADQDDELAQTLGDCLAAAGELDEARVVLGDLIARFGRRRSPERAAAHVSLSLVLQKLGLVDEAITELETAVQIDSSNLSILARLGQSAAQSERWDTAERAYRMLLLALGRDHEENRTPIYGDLAASRAEVLYELSTIAAARGHEDQAQELAESALDAAMDDSEGSARLRAMLWERGGRDLLARLLQAEAAVATTSLARAKLWAELARLRQSRDDQPSEILDVWLRVVVEQPSSPDYHAAARACAEAADQLDRYAAALAELSDAPTVISDPFACCEVLLRRGELYEQGLGQPHRAQECYELAEQTEVRVIDVWRAQARLAGLLGDGARQAEVLERLANVGEDEHGTRAAALYTLAEIQLARADTAVGGVAALERALEDAPNDGRALTILEAACNALAEQGDIDMNVLAIYERVCRERGDDERLLHCLRAVAFHPHAEPEQVHTAYELACRLERADEVDSLLARAVACTRDLPDGPRRASWAFQAAAQRCVERGDVTAAGDHYLAVFDALAEGERGAVYAFAKNLAYGDDSNDDELRVVLRIYERALEIEATSREIWEPLARIYERLGDLDALRLIHDDIVDGLPSSDERNALRCVLARALVQRGTDLDEAMERLGEVLDEDPECGEAQELLAECMAKTGDTDKLVELLEGQLAAAYDAGELERAAGLSLRLGALFESDDLERALALYREAVARGGSGRKLLLALRRGLEASNAGEELTRVYEQLIGYEDDASAKSALAVLAARRYFADEALDEARRVLQDVHDADAPDARLVAQLEKTLEAMGDTRALADLLVATASGETAGDRLRRAAEGYRQVGEPSEALTALERAREVESDDANTFASWCEVMRELGRVHEIIAELTMSLESIDTPSARAKLLRLRGECYEERQDAEAALADYEAAFALVPEADLAERLQHTVAAHMVELETSDEPDLAKLRELTLTLARLHAAQGRLAEQRAVLVAWVERDRKDVEVLARVVELATRDEDWEAAVSASTQLVAVTADEAQVDAARWLDRSARAYGDPELARRGLEHVRRKQPENVEVRELLVAHYETTAAHAKLAKLLVAEAEVESDDERRAGLLGRAGELAVSGGDSELAIDLLGQAVALRPDETSWVLALVDAHVYCGDVSQAASVIEVAISASRRRGADLALLQRKRATLADLAGEKDAQLEWLENAMTSDRHNLEIAMDLAAAAEEACSWELALKALRTIALSDEATSVMRAESFARQGRIALITGDLKRARFYAHKARHEDAEVPVVMELDRLLEEQGG